MRILNRLGGIELSQAYALHQGDQQEEARRSSTQRKAEFIDGASRARASTKDDGRGDLRPDRVLRRLRLQQVAHDRLRPGRLPDGLPQGALPDRVHGRPAVQRDRRRQQARHAWSSTSTTPASSASRCCRRTSTRGEADFTVADGKIVFGLAAIKGLGRGAAEEIVRARDEGGPFKDLFDFCERVDRKVVSRRRRSRRSSRPARSTASAATGAQLLPSCRGPSQAAERAAAGPQARPDAASSTCSRRRGGDGDGRAPATALPDVPEWPETREAQVREGGARLLHLQPPAGPARERARSASPRTRVEHGRTMPSRPGGHARRHADAGARS